MAPAARFKGARLSLGSFARSGDAADMRRGVGELDGHGEVVGGVVIMRFGEDAQKVIERVKQRITDIEPT